MAEERGEGGAVAARGGGEDMALDIAVLPVGPWCHHLTAGLTRQTRQSRFAFASSSVVHGRIVAYPAYGGYTVRIVYWVRLSCRRSSAH